MQHRAFFWFTHIPCFVGRISVKTQPAAKIPLTYKRVDGGAVDLVTKLDTGCYSPHEKENRFDCVMSEEMAKEIGLNLPAHCSERSKGTTLYGDFQKDAGRVEVKHPLKDQYHTARVRVLYKFDPIKDAPVPVDRQYSLISYNLMAEMRIKADPARDMVVDCPEEYQEELD